MESPGSSGDNGAAAVCCMCGDHGMPGELFQCGLCRLRMQHRYCSELYPSEAEYRSCNWCLRESGSTTGGCNPPVMKAATASNKRSRRRDSGADSMNMIFSPAACTGCKRTAFSPEPAKPVKKLKKKKRGSGTVLMERRPVTRTTTMAAANNGRRREVQVVGAARKARFRVKVRRYKLLAEVTC